CLTNRQPHNAVLDLGRMHACTPRVRSDRLAARQLDDEVVQRTGDTLVVDDALRQRSALVRTAIVERKHVVIRRAEHGDVSRRCPHDPRAEPRNIVQGSDFDPPGHASSNSAIGANSLRSTPRWARSAHGSLCENCCEYAKRPKSAL